MGKASGTPVLENMVHLASTLTYLVYNPFACVELSFVSSLTSKLDSRVSFYSKKKKPFQAVHSVWVGVLDTVSQLLRALKSMSAQFIQTATFGLYFLFFFIFS